MNVRGTKRDEVRGKCVECH